jgi:hypothetical protein
MFQDYETKIISSGTVPRFYAGMPFYIYVDVILADPQDRSYQKITQGRTVQQEKQKQEDLAGVDFLMKFSSKKTAVFKKIELYREMVEENGRQKMTIEEDIFLYEQIKREDILTISDGVAEEV